ncbi:hypothetical protein ATG98_2469 [Marinobacter sp. LV10R520-4]|nr:hypothetical protein ATG98_2469 [Marinobacter sp. LV10R520-4]
MSLLLIKALNGVKFCDITWDSDVSLLADQECDSLIACGKLTFKSLLDISQSAMRQSFTA